MYGLAAGTSTRRSQLTSQAIGKIGAFAGTWAFPALIADLNGDNPDSTRGIVGRASSCHSPLTLTAFYLGSGLAILAALITFVCIREVPTDHMHIIDEEFKQALIDSGYDVSTLGMHGQESAIARVLAPETKDADAPSFEDKDESPNALDEEKRVA